MTPLPSVSDPSGRVRLRLNPWDEAAMGFPVAEILDMERPDPAVFDFVDRQVAQWAAGLCLFRRACQDLDVKAACLRRGFYIAECSLVLHASLAGSTAEAHFQVEKPAPGDVELLMSLAEREFQYSRLHEDPWCTPEQARRRYRGWVAQLAEEGKLFLMRQESQPPMGLFSYELDGDHCTVLLIGIDGRSKGLGVYALSTLLNHLRPKARSFSARVSAANTAMLNLYLHFGAVVRSSDFGYYKRYPPR